MQLFETPDEHTRLALFDGAAVLLTVARHERDYMACVQKIGPKGTVYYDVAGYRYHADGAPLPQLPRAPQILDVVDLYQTDYADIA